MFLLDQANEKKEVSLSINIAYLSPIAPTSVLSLANFTGHSPLNDHVERAWFRVPISISMISPTHVSRQIAIITTPTIIPHLSY